MSVSYFYRNCAIAEQSVKIIALKIISISENALQ